MNLNDGSLGNNTQLGVEWRLRILFHSQYVKIKCCLQFRVGHMSLLQKGDSIQLHRLSCWRKRGYSRLNTLKRRAAGLINRSYLGGLRVKLSPTNVTFRTIRFHDFSEKSSAHRGVNPEQWGEC